MTPPNIKWLQIQIVAIYVASDSMGWAMATELHEVFLLVLAGLTRAPVLSFQLGGV